MVESLLADINLFRVLLRVYVVQGTAASEAELIERASNALLGIVAEVKSDDAEEQKKKAVCFRVRGFPKTMETLLETTLVQDDGSVCLSTRDLHHRVLCVMSINDGILFGSYIYTAPIALATKVRQNENSKNSVHASEADLTVTSLSNNTTGSNSSQRHHHRVSRASWKLVEVFRRRPSFHPSTFKFQRPFIAVDIGASPGGWSYELASMPQCGKVYAVDPGALTPPIPGNVVHLAQKIEDCTEEFKTQGVKFDCVVCDMNASPRMTVESFLGLKETIRSGAVVVLTFKNFVGGRKAFAKALEEALVLLDGVIVGQNILRLMSGGQEERTLVGFYTCK